MVKRRLFVQVPHAWDECRCDRCDGARQENGSTRAHFGWPPCYPPGFYSRVMDPESAYWSEREVVAS